MRSLRQAGPAAISAIALAVLLVLGPLIWVIRVALKPTEEFIGAPSEWGGSWTVENFSTAWQTGGMATALMHSATAVGAGTVLAVSLASATGFALARYRYRGKTITIVLVTVTLFLPVSALVIPLFELFKALGLLSSLVWLGVVYGVLFSAWATIFLRSFFLQLPNEMFEAAEVDGAGAIRTFISIALPVARPAIATAFVLTFFLQWSELLLALLLLPDGNSPTVAVSIAQFTSQFRSGGPLTAAAMIIGTLPVLALFIFSQRWLQAGVLSGAIKD